MRLEKDHSCRTGLAWRTTIPQGPLGDALLDAFDDAGFPLSSESFGLVVFEERNTRHRVLVVPATGRLQLRLHYITPSESRLVEAERVGELLGRIFHDGDESNEGDEGDESGGESDKGEAES